MSTRETSPRSQTRAEIRSAPVLALYATRHGHTRRVAEYVADKLRARGLPVELVAVRSLPATVDLSLYRAVLLAASVHAGKHEREMIRFVRKHRARLTAMNTAFLSLSLTQAGAEDSTWSDERRSRATRDVQVMIDGFCRDTQFHPDQTQPVAGALLYTKYNFLVRFVMKRIARTAGASTDTTRDHEYTNWAALDGFAASFAQQLEREAASSAAHPAQMAG